MPDMSDEDFRSLIQKTFSKESRNERAKIIEDSMENDGDNSKRFNAKFKRARDNAVKDRGFKRVRGETQAQEDFIDFGTKINPSEREGGMAMSRGVKRKFAKDGFMGTVSMKTLFTVGEGKKAEFVTRKKQFTKNGKFVMEVKEKKKKSNNIFDVGGF